MGELDGQYPPFLRVRTGRAGNQFFFDAADVISGVFACSNVLADQSLNDFHSLYLVLTVVAVGAGTLSMVHRLKRMVRSYGAKKVETMEIFSFDETTPMLAKLDREILSRKISVLVLCFEDLPLTILNIHFLLVNKLDAGNYEVQVSLVISLLVIGMKSGHLEVIRIQQVQRRNLEAKSVKNEMPAPL